MTISFYQRGKVIQARISEGKNYFRISTGIDVLPHHKFVGEKFIGNTVEVANMNKELARHRVKLTELFAIYGLNFDRIKANYQEKAPELPTGDSFKLNDLTRRYVSLMGTGDILNLSKKRYSLASVNLYKYASDLLNEFSYAYDSIDISEYHIHHDWSSQQKQDVTNNFNHYFKEFENHLIDRGNGVKSRSEIMNMIGVMMNYWSNKLFFNLPKIPRLVSHEKAIVVLPPELVTKFLNDKATYEKLSDEMKTVWEISATILITTLRIGDALSIKVEDLVINRDNVFLKKKNEKTGVYSEMPLPRFLSDLYRENLARYGRVYTVKPSKDIVYENLKDLFRMYEDAHQTVSVAQVDIRGNEFVVSKTLWEWVHPHMLRKTAITNMIYNKVPERFIKFASGHALKSNAFERYVGHVERYYQSEINDYYGRMFS